MAAASTPPLNNNPDDHKSLAAAMRFVLNSFSQDLECCLPAVVQLYDPEKNVATVRPIIAQSTRDGKRLPRPEIDSVPVLSIGAGGFHIHAPLKPGDLGWLYAADRDTSLFMQDLTEIHANTERSHAFVDGVFIPDVFRQYTLQAEDTDALVLQSTDSATRISIRADNIKITAPSNVTFDTPVVHILHDAIVDGTITGNTSLVVNGNATITGTLTTGGKNVNTHTHNVTGSTTGPML